MQTDLKSNLIFEEEFKLKNGYNKSHDWSGNKILSFIWTLHNLMHILQRMTEPDVVRMYKKAFSRALYFVLSLYYYWHFLA